MSFRSIYRGAAMLLVCGAVAAVAPGAEPTSPSDPNYDGNGYQERRAIRYPYDAFPASTVQGTASAKAGAARARWQFHTTYQTMGRVIRFAKEDFEYSPEMQEALAEEAEAYAAYESARRAALAPLEDDFQYQTYVMLVNDLQRDIENLRAKPNPPENELLAMSSVKLNYTTRARDKEVLLLADDENFNQARERLVNAANRVSTMRATFERSLRRNPEVAALRDQLQQDKINKVTAEAYAKAMEEARDIGLNYAAYVNRDRVYTSGFGRPRYGFILD